MINSGQLSHETNNLDTLMAQIEAMSSCEAQLRVLLNKAHDQIERRERELQTALAELQDQAAKGSQEKAAPLPPAVPPRAAESVASEYIQYQQLIGRIREIVHSAVPRGARVIVVSKGDEELLKLDGRAGWHFPQSDDGVYAGYYPADSAMAIAHLEALRAKGGQYLLFPRTAFWWLDHYADFKQHLENQYHEIARREDICRIFALRKRGARRKPVNDNRRLSKSRGTKAMR